MVRQHDEWYLMKLLEACNKVPYEYIVSKGYVRDRKAYFDAQLEWLKGHQQQAITPPVLRLLDKTFEAHKTSLESIFSHELYHQYRTSLEGNMLDLVLNCEVNKTNMGESLQRAIQSQNYQVKFDYFQKLTEDYCKGKKSFRPDMVLHQSQGSIEDQLLIVETKRKDNLDFYSFMDDMVKLLVYKELYRFIYPVFIAFDISFSDLKKKVIEKNNGKDPFQEFEWINMLLFIVQKDDDPKEGNFVLCGFQDNSFKVIAG